MIGRSGRLHLVAAARELSIEVAALRARLPVGRVQEALTSSVRERATAGLEGILRPQEVEETLTVRIVDLSLAAEPTMAVARALADLLEVPLHAFPVSRWPELPRGARVDLDLQAPGPELERAAELELRAVIPSSPDSSI